MASFRILNQAPQYLLADGSVNAGGSLTFYETNLTDLKNTWSDEAMTTLNSNPVVMDAAGRTLTDVWGDGEYGVVMKDAADVVQWTRNNVKQSGDAGAAIPALQDGEFLTNDGSVMSWQPILQVPDPTGHSGQVLYSDGSLSYWAALPDTTPPDPEIVVTENSFRAGVSTDTTKWLEQTGTGSAAASGGKTATASVVYPTPFIAAATYVDIVPTSASSCALANIIPGWAITVNSTTGFTVTFSTLTGGSSADGFSSSNIIGAVPFMYKATGTVVVVP